MYGCTELVLGKYSACLDGDVVLETESGQGLTLGHAVVEEVAPGVARHHYHHYHHHYHNQDHHLDPVHVP